MKQLLLKITVSAAIIFTSVFATDVVINLCEVNEIKDDCKKELTPYDFDSFKISRFNVKDKPIEKEIEVMLFRGEKYRFVFNTELLDAPVKVEIYDRQKDHRRSSLLFSSDNLPHDHKQFIFEPEKSRKMYVYYTVKPNEETTKHKGCVVMMLGYEIKFFR